MGPLTIACTGGRPYATSGKVTLTEKAEGDLQYTEPLVLLYLLIQRNMEKLLKGF